ncbi:hypothetical protein G9A89_010743 [Geosiphon pyriformis]|nr:hypothetical protein G9A89_010743 [Geosiphon pyriformis]
MTLNYDNDQVTSSRNSSLNINANFSQNFDLNDIKPIKRDELLEKFSFELNTNIGDETNQKRHRGRKQHNLGPNSGHRLGYSVNRNFTLAEVSLLKNILKESGDPPADLFATRIWPPDTNDQHNPEFHHYQHYLNEDGMVMKVVDHGTTNSNPVFPVFKEERPKNENFSNSCRKRTRNVTSPYQARVLRNVYAATSFPSTEMREALGKALNMRPRTVQIWFQNQRQKGKNNPESNSLHAARILKKDGWQSPAVEMPISQVSSTDAIYFQNLAVFESDKSEGEVDLNPNTISSLITGDLGQSGYHQNQINDIKNNDDVSYAPIEAFSRNKDQECLHQNYGHLQSETRGFLPVTDFPIGTRFNIAMRSTDSSPFVPISHPDARVTQIHSRTTFTSFQNPPFFYRSSSISPQYPIHEALIKPIIATCPSNLQQDEECSMEQNVPQQQNESTFNDFFDSGFQSNPTLAMLATTALQVEVGDLVSASCTN